MNQFVSRTLPAAFFMLFGLISISVSADIKSQVRQELAKTSAQVIPLTNSGHFYSMGQTGYFHEQAMAEKFADWVKDQEGKKFLFIPGIEGMETPGIDGTVFDDDVTHPLKRISFKSIQSPKNILHLTDVILDAARKTKRFSSFDKTFDAIFPKDARAYPGWMNRVYLMSAMGLKSTDRISNVVVVDLGQSLDDEETKRVISLLKQLLSETEYLLPDQVVLFSQNRVYPLNNGVDYSRSCISEVTSMPEHPNSYWP